MNAESFDPGFLCSSISFYGVFFPEAKLCFWTSGDAMIVVSSADFWVNADGDDLWDLDFE